MGELVLPMLVSSKHGTCKMNLELEKTTWHASFKKKNTNEQFWGVWGGYWLGFMANSSRGT